MMGIRISVAPSDGKLALRDLRSHNNVRSFGCESWICVESFECGVVYSRHML